MAKRKKRKQEKEGFTYASELAGLILILAGIIGFGDFGIVGNFVKNFAIFLFGQFYFIVLIIFFALGLYMVIKRSAPNFLNARLIGIYLLVISTLILAHQNYITDDVKILDVLSNTFNNISLTFKNSSAILGNDTIIQTGGGIIGALLSSVNAFLFGKTGTYVVVGIFIVFGIIMLFNITISDMIHFVLKPFKGNTKFSKNEKTDPIISLPSEDEEDNEKKTYTASGRKIVNFSDM